MGMKESGGEGLLYRLPKKLEKSDHRYHRAVPLVFQVIRATELTAIPSPVLT